MAKRKPWLGGWSKADRALLKKADRRLRELEKPGRTFLQQFAYRTLANDLKRLGLIGENDRPRVDRKRPANEMTARALLNRVVKFMSSPTSTITGWQRLQRSNLQKFNERLGLDDEQRVTMEELDVLSDIFEDEKYYSETVMTVIQAVKTRDVELLDALGMIRTRSVQTDMLGVSHGEIELTGDTLLQKISGALGEDVTSWKEWTV